MKLEIVCYNSLCALDVFKINGIEADYHDFGVKEDVCPDDAEPYGCGNMKFTPKPATQEILNEYQITLEEYKEICDRLENELDFGKCGWCV